MDRWYKGAAGAPREGSMTDVLGYQGKTVVITGAASGMGGAATELLVDLGAEVHALDVAEIAAPVKQAIAVDLADAASIDAAVARLPAKIDVLFHCAGVPGPPRFDSVQTMLVNFVGLRQLTESLLDRIADGGAIASITSVAGMGWQKNLDNVKTLMGITDFAETRAWCEANPDVANGYLFSKQCIIYYTKLLAVRLLDRQIRVNCLSPSPTDTAMLPDFHAQAGKDFLEEHFLAPVGRNARPDEMAKPLIFLGSDLAGFVSGQNLFVDFGYLASVETGAKVGLL
jgi:NAD(P)-dependent dehydrogenase (short-subunit alcohol dehydrogenase family)